MYIYISIRLYQCIYNMSVDKFGRYETTVRKAVLRGPPGVGFKTTAEGDYDMRAKRLCVVGEPKDVHDAVTVNYVNEKCLQLKKTDGGERVYFDANKRWIRHLKEPIETTDAVNKAYVDERTPVRGDDEWDFGKVRLSHVAEPKSGADAANKLYVDKRTPVRGRGEWNFSNMRLSNIAGPKTSADAVNKAFLETQTPTRRKEEWDFSNMRLTNVADPVLNNDGVNLSFLVSRVLNPLDHNTLVLDTNTNSYDAKGKCIGNVLDAVTDTDAVNLRLLNAFRKSVEDRFKDISDKFEDEMASMAHMVVSRVRSNSGLRTATKKDDVEEKL